MVFGQTHHNYKGHWGLSFYFTLVLFHPVSIISNESISKHLYMYIYTSIPEANKTHLFTKFPCITGRIIPNIKIRFSLRLPPRFVVPSPLSSVSTPTILPKPQTWMMALSLPYTTAWDYRNFSYFSLSF